MTLIQPCSPEPERSPSLSPEPGEGASRALMAEMLSLGLGDLASRCPSALQPELGVLCSCARLSW